MADESREPPRVEPVVELRGAKREVLVTGCIADLGAGAWGAVGVSGVA